MTGRVASQVRTPGGTMYSTCQGDSNGTPTSLSSRIQGTNTPRKTPIWTSGSGMGSRRSYSLYSRFSMRQMFVYVGRSTPLLPSLRERRASPGQETSTPRAVAIALAVVSMIFGT